MVEQPDNGTSLQQANCACLKGNLYLFGGTVTTSGPMFGYIWCSFDLQEFSTRYSQVRSGPCSIMHLWRSCVC